MEYKVPPTPQKKTGFLDTPVSATGPFRRVVVNAVVMLKGLKTKPTNNTAKVYKDRYERDDI